MYFFIEDMDEINKIVNESNSAKEIIEKINSSSRLNLENNFGIICDTIKSSKDSLYYEFMNELIDMNRIDLIKDNPNYIGIRNLFEFAEKSNNSELIEFICKNFKNIIDMAIETEYLNIRSIKPFILKEEFSEEIKEVIPVIIRNTYTTNRVKLIKIISENKQLGNVEEYLSDFLYTPIGLFGMDEILLELDNVKNLDKIKLLQEVNDNFYNLINSFRGVTHRLISFLDKVKQIENELPENSEEAHNIINEVNDSISDNFENMLVNHDYNPILINLLRQFNINNSRFRNIQDNIINELSGPNLIIYIQSARENEGFNKDWDYLKLTSELFKHNKEVIEDKTLQITISKLIEELCEHENIGINDLEFGGVGHFNFNIKIGSYILKLGEGENRRTSKIENDKRIFKPLVRQLYNAGNIGEGANMFIEIQNVGDDKWYIGLSEDEIKEQLYEVYKELRDRGKVWVDVKPENVARLLKPNKENFEIEVLNQEGKLEKRELKSNNYAINFIGDESDEVLGPGELAIIDTDYIYNENDEIYNIPKKSYYDEFEERYQAEKKNKQETENNINQDIIRKIAIDEIREKDYTTEDLRKMQEDIEKVIEISSKDISRGE